MESVVLPENLQQQLHPNHSQQQLQDHHHSQQKQQQHHQADEEIPMIDGDESKEVLEYSKGTTTPKPRQQRQQSLDAEISRLQSDLRDITAKIEDYNFSQNELGRELGLGGGIKSGRQGGAEGAGETRKKNESTTRKEWKKSEEKKALKSSTTLPLLGEAAVAGKSPTLPLLLPGLMTIAGGEAGNETDDRYINYSRQITRDDGPGYSQQMSRDDGVYAYMRQSTMMTDDTLLTESNRQTTNDDEKAGKVHL